MMLLSNFLIYLACYLIGSLPSGFIIARLISGQDIRKQGSGNIGATNIARIYGKRAGVLTFIADCAKSVLALKFAEAFGGELYFAAFLVIVGHIFPVWLKFRGGKGVATFFATLLYINPLLAAIFAVCWVGIFALFKISALASIVSSLGVLLFTLFTLRDKDLSYFVIIISILVIAAHRDNIRRMLAGNELKFKEHDEKRN